MASITTQNISRASSVLVPTNHASAGALASQAAQNPSSLQVAQALRTQAVRSATQQGAEGAPKSAKGRGPSADKRAEGAFRETAPRDTVAQSRRRDPGSLDVEA